MIYRKEDFQSFILRHITKWVSINGKPAQSVGDMIGFSAAFIGVGFGFFIIGLIILTQEISWGAILFTLLPTIHVSVGIWKYLQLRVYRSLEKYFEIKESLLEKQSTLDAIRAHDRDQSGIDPVEVEAFAYTLKNLSLAYQSLQSPIAKIEKWKQSFEKAVEQELFEFVRRECQWMIDYMISCRDIVRLWSMHHESELREVISSIRNTDTNMLAGKEALDLVETRLENHINNLEKIRVLI